MRTSRLSKETSAIFKASTSPPPTRRTTRSSLARFAYTTDSSAPDTTLQNIVLGNDIEDAVTSPPLKKRRRVAAADDVPSAAVKVETEAAEVTSTKPTKPKRERKPARVIKGEDIRVEPPSDWEEMYNQVKEMRLHGAAKDAAVDTMGCERLFHPDASERDRRFHILIALMLSSQTKDTVNAVAMKRLMTELPPHKEGAEGGLCLENILAVEPDKLNELIWAVGFHNNKTKYIKAAAEILRDKFDGDVPDTIEGLTSLPGVGPKMGYLCLSAAWDKTEGIGVDVHVHRITNLWGWHKTTQPEGTRMALQSWLPNDKWREINWLLVGLGQTVCLPVGRKCGDCQLGLKGLCKAAERKKVTEGRKAREVKVEVGDDTVIKTEEIVEEVVKKEVVEPTGVPVPEVAPEASELVGAGAPKRRRGKVA
ncbi:Endonuclease III-like [Colletotrichum gloeosporioides]|uniref:Endonuclease III homolog n=1 Tax=Colletotrichum gloeosporioides TaxID=474922 RepID=A0A8H4FNN4_COLGL|nr:Endonuclease III-like [Colletotrichum gloeosporioides]KAF3808817.1 Endonuclease III-like [Colletotrichum gloeosporioides]